MAKVTGSGHPVQGSRLGVKAIFTALVVALCVGVFASVALADDGAGGGGVSALATAAPSDNNPLAEKCGLNIVLVVDRSGSTDDFNQAYKDAAKAFVSTLVGTPSSIGLVTFNNDAHLETGYKSVAVDDNGLLNEIQNNLAIDPPSGLTNWQDALEVTTANFANPVADLVVFITDGNPTDHNGGGDDLGNAIVAANALKALGSNHPHITGVAVGDDIDTASIADITGAGPGFGGADPDVHESDADTLADDVKALALELCGGTVTVHKQVRTGPATIDSTTPGLVDGWTFTASTGPTGSTGADGTGAVNLDFAADQLGANTITESAGLAGYAIESVNCNGNAVDHVGSNFGVTVGQLDIVSCTVVNSPTALGSITVNKVTTHGAGGPFTVNVSGPNATNSNLVGSTVTKDTSVALGSVSSLYPGDYVIDETVMPAGWAFGGVQCSDGVAVGDAVNVHVDPGENVVCTYTNDLVPSNLTIAKSSTEGANTGTSQQLDYTLTVDNEGPADAHVDATAVDMLPAGASLVSVDPPAGVVCDTSALPKVSCTIPAGQLEVSDPAVEIGVTVDVANGSGTVTNKTIVTSPDDPAPCEVTSDDIVCSEPTDNYAQVSNEVPEVAANTATTGGPQVEAAQAQALAFTGSDRISSLIGSAALLVAAGLAALVVARSRRQGSVS